MQTDRRVPIALLSATRKGAIVTVEGEGGEYRGRLVRIDGEEAEVHVFEELPFASEPPIDIVLIQAVPKKERMEFVIQKATELGVKAIFPCMSEKSNTPGTTGGQDKSHRWQAVARRAVGQCRRRLVPRVAPCRDFKEALREQAVGNALKLILYEKERTARLKDLLERPPGGKPERVVIACGPEGGFTGDEVRMATENGFIPVSLGSRVLRCETAALAVLSIVQHEWGDL
jgi:16S rRNA (uracil1498-N3)-methyltransferase